MVTSKWVRKGKKVCFVMMLVIFICLISCQGTFGDTYLNKFAVHVRGGREVAERLAEQHGHRLVAPIGSLEDHYLFEHPHVRRRSANPHRYHNRKLSEHPQVQWVEQQKLLSRKKRDFQSAPETIQFNDDLWSQMWYFHGGGYNNTDMNVIPAWNKGFSGRNVVVTILDDGIERIHDDLIDNYDPYASYDVNDHDPDPMPRYNPTNENRHGTRCAGEVAAKANNTKCVVGVAFNSKIGGVRMLDGDVFDAVEATSLSFNRSHVDIYSASWGPDDDGRVVDGPGPLAWKAFEDGINQGRGGKGSIFVWASGNGGNAKDSCNCDGYTNSIYTLSISSISQEGKKPWYLEECSSTLATTYSSGAYREKQIISVDLHNRCTDTHTGTSASAPLAAGIVALVLEAKPDLTWRDVQYITLMTARPMPDGDWVTNGVGRQVSLRYGYGIMDASAMVDLALKWTNVPEQHICEVPSPIQNSEIPDSGYVETLDTSACDGNHNSIKFLEHVQARIKMKTKRRGDIVLHLTSPMGTLSTILPQRPNDGERAKGFDKWAFLSVHFWGENPVGRWKLQVEIQHNPNAWDGGSFPGATTNNVLESWSLVLYGTEENPIKLTSQPRTHPPNSTPAPAQSTSATTQSPMGCHSECKGNCSGPKANQCDECKHYKISDSGNCVSNCPPDHFSYNSVCKLCPSSCSQCSSVSQSSVICTQCKPGFLLVENRGECVKQCETGYFRAHNATTAPLVQERSDVECQATSLKIFIPIHLLPGNGTVTWRDSGCVVHSNGTHFVDSVGLRDCGTTLTFEADSVVFENDLILHKNGVQMQIGNSIITYGSDYDFAIPVKCVYPRNSNISTSYIPIVQQVKILERRNGQLDLSMRQYEAEDYSNPVPFNAYPRQVPLNKDIFIRLSMENNVTGLGLNADNCFATSTPSPVDPNWYQLISSGCPVNAARLHPSGINDVKFSFHAFNFRHNTSGIVYVHCQVSVCLDTDPACVAGCVTRKKRSSSVREGAITSNLISTGPFILTADEGGVAMSTVVASVSMAVAVIATVVAIIGWTRKSKKGAES